jgi:hypothetical protein
MYPIMIKDVTKGPTAHNLIKAKSTSRMREKIFNFLPKVDRKNDILLFSFGEADCRIHIYRQHVKTGVSISTLIDRTICRYTEFIGEIEDMGYTVYLLGVPPCGRQGNKYNFDYYPLPSQQAEIFKLFNDRMRHNLGDIYIDMYSPTVDTDGFMKKEYVGDDIHLNKKALVIIVNTIKEFMQRGSNDNSRRATG